MPYFNDARKTLFVSFSQDALLRGLTPSSRIKASAMRTVRHSIAARMMYGTPRFVLGAITPPATVPVSIAIPDAIAPFAKTDSKVPLNFAACSPSTSQASVAPEKNVKPRPKNIETTAHAQNGPLDSHSIKYRMVDANNVAAPSRYDIRRPNVSATTPVGNSKSTCPAV